MWNADAPTEELQVLLAAVGSAGDVYPFIGLGQNLQRRGHRVTLIANAYFQDAVHRAGLAFVEHSADDDYLSATSARRFAFSSNAAALAMFARKLILPAMPRIFQEIADRFIPGQTVVAASSLALGARIAQEAFGAPLATIEVCPYALRSEHDSPQCASWLPARVKRLIFGVHDAVVDRLLGADVNAFRAEFGLPPVHKLFDRWWKSPERVIGLFPDWFALPQPDWPPQVRTTGFPLYDQQGAVEVPPETRSFVEQGSPPLVFTMPSWMRHAGWFFRTSVRVCQLLGRRGILLTGYEEQVPRNLPSDVRHFQYVPLSWLLPRAAALIHHGGIGTMSQAMASGVPQIAVPFILDQPDIARRAAKLGVSTTLPPFAYRPRIAAAVIRRTLDSAEVQAACRRVALRLQDHHGLDAACGMIEELAHVSVQGLDAHGNQQTSSLRTGWKPAPQGFRMGT